MRFIWICCFFPVLVFAISLDRDDQEKDQEAPREKELGKYFVFADIIVWNARAPGATVTALGNWNNTTDSDTGFTLEQGNIIYPKWKWKPGFKVGIGKGYTPEHWITIFQYTWFYNQKNSFGGNANFLPGQGLPAWPLVPFLELKGTDFILHVDSYWNNQFNRMDWIFYQDLSPACFFSFQPFFGLVGWLEKEWFHIRYVNPEHDHIKIAAKQTAGGIGPYVGTDLQFFFYKTCWQRWSLFGHFGLGFPWSYYHSFSHIFNIEKNEYIQRTRHMYANTTPVVEALLGFRLLSVWEMGYVMFFQFGWETQLWLDHIHAFDIYLQRQGVNANYAMQGFTGRIGFYF